MSPRFILAAEPMRRPDALCVILFVLVAGAACDRSDKASGQTPFDVNDVQATFKEATGDELVVRGTLTVIPEWGNVTALEVPERLRKKYGEFGITVFESPERLTRAIELEGEKPNARSIYWRYTPVNEERRTPSWSAAKRYENVRLVWINRARQTDEHWDVLDATKAPA